MTEYINLETKEIKTLSEAEEWFVPLIEHLQQEQAKKEDKRNEIISEYTLEEQLNIMREAIIALCKKNDIQDSELYNMHDFICDVLWRDKKE